MEIRDNMELVTIILNVIVTENLTGEILILRMSRSTYCLF